MVPFDRGHIYQIWRTICHEYQ